MTAGRVVVASEFRVQRTPDGACWGASGFGHDYWSNVLGAPTPTILVARAEPAERAPGGASRVDGDLVDVMALPPLRLRPSLPVEAVRAAAMLWRRDPDGAPLLRLPGITPALLLLVSLLRRRPFAVHVVGDPIDVAFRAGIGGTPGKVIGVAQWAILRVACRRASVCAYVTERYLQRRYPPGPATSTFSISNVTLPLDPTPLRAAAPHVRRLVTVGSLDRPYKRVDLLLEALAVLRAEGWDVGLDVVGGGRTVPALEERCRRLGLAPFVTMHGAVPPDRVQRLLAEADLFVLCSDTEGLPRALIEAMAAGLPCVGSDVGGVSELLGPEALFTPGSLPGLVGALRRYLLSPALRARAVSANVDRAASFAPGALATRRARLRDELLGVAS